MAKKKIIGQSKLVNTSSPEQSSEDLNIISRKVKLKPTSFRLTSEDKVRLKNITSSVNDLSINKKVSETMIVKALLLNAQKMKPEALLKALKEALF